MTWWPGFPLAATALGSRTSASRTRPTSERQRLLHSWTLEWGPRFVTALLVVSSATRDASPFGVAESRAAGGGPSGRASPYPDRTCASVSLTERTTIKTVRLHCKPRCVFGWGARGWRVRSVGGRRRDWTQVLGAKNKRPKIRASPVTVRVIKYPTVPSPGNARAAPAARA